MLLDDARVSVRVRRAPPASAKPNRAMGVGDHVQDRGMENEISAPQRSRPTYVVLEEISDETWRILGEVQRQPGLPARRGRAKAVADALGHEPSDGKRYAVIPLSEWRNGCDW